jgi:excisionase family DNA binding protein
VTELESSIRAIVVAVVEELLARRDAPVSELTVVEWARRHSLSTTTVYQAIRDGRLDAKRYGRAVRVPASAEMRRPTSKRDAVASARAKLLRPRTA